jgi:hypothetical protein
MVPILSNAQKSFIHHDCSSVNSRLTTVGAPFLASAGGKVYYEIEVCSDSGRVWAGFAGTHFGSDFRDNTWHINEDDACWCVESGLGESYHG